MYEATGGDLRQAINLLQAASAGGEVTIERVEAVTGATVKERAAEIIKLALDGDFNAARIKLVELTRVYGIPETDFLRFANEAVVASRRPRAWPAAIKIVAEYDYRLILGASPEIQLTAMLAELARPEEGESDRMDLSLPRGIRDIEPEEYELHQRIRAAFDELTVAYNFKPMEPAPLESLAVLRAKSGAPGRRADLPLQGQGGEGHRAALRPHRRHDAGTWPERRG